MKKTLKFLQSLFIGIVIGFGIVAIAIAIFSDIPMGEFINELISVNMITTLAYSFLAVFIALITQTLAHEGGHLLFGLLTGYRFVSFRIFSFTIIKKNGRLQFKKYSVLGTGGQCLMSPPCDVPLHEIPYSLYNFGGVILNFIVATAALAILLVYGDMGAFITLLLSFLVFVGLLFIFLNGVPMKLSGVPNDGYNGLYLGRSTNARVCFARQLLINEQLQLGVRPKDMPQEWFGIIDPNLSDPLQLAILNAQAARHIDMLNFTEALNLYNRLAPHAQKITLFKKEIDSELVFLNLVCGNIETAKCIYTKSLEAYVMQFAKTMSSKDRVRFALALYADKNIDRAKRLRENLFNHYNCYLLTGEVDSDLAVMDHLLNEELKKTQ